MTAASDSLDDLEGDLKHMSVLIEVITDMAIDFPAGEAGQLRDHVNRIAALLWIARDISGQLVLNAASCSSKALTDGKSEPVRMTGGQRT